MSPIPLKEKKLQAFVAQKVSRKRGMVETPGTCGWCDEGVGGARESIHDPGGDLMLFYYHQILGNLGKMNCGRYRMASQGFRAARCAVLQRESGASLDTKRRKPQRTGFALQFLVTKIV
jgi:hypothetical protein